MLITKSGIAGALTVLACVSASADPVIFSSLNQTPGGALTSDVVAARNAFLGAFNTQVGTYGFEQIGGSPQPGDGGPLTATFASSGNTAIVATIEGTGTVSGTNQSGRFNTTGLGTATPGSQYWQVGEVNGASSDFTIDFNVAISAFGFYATDVGDFGGTLTLLLTREDGSGIDQLVVDSGTANNNGSLLFYGFADAAARYTRVSFLISDVGTAGQGDFFGFDDFVVADAGQITVPPPQGVPEPASLALVGLSLLSLAATRRAKK